MIYSTEDYFNISVENILKKISEQDIFKHYIKGYDGTSKKFCSELRIDKIPSCSIKQLPSGRWVYRDFGDGNSYTCFDYVQALYNTDFYSTLRLIVNDIVLGTIGEIAPKPVIDSSKIVSSSSEIRIVPIEFTAQALSYWNSYNISIELLKRYKVKQISHYYINNVLITIPKKEIGFAYCFGDYKYKILRPLNKEWKWINNCNSSIIQGYNQLPEKADLLLITSSLKDVMTLKSIGYISVAPQSENTTIQETKIQEFKERFKKILLFYNNDNAGLKASEYHSKLYNVQYIYFPICMEKDPSDFCKNKGKESLIQMVSKLISNVRF